MSPTGVRRSEWAFSLIELMVAVSILSLGTVLILQSNMISLSVYGKYVHQLAIQRWADEKVWETKRLIMESEVPAVGPSSGSIEKDRKIYQWNLNVKTGGIKELYTIHLDVSWREEDKTLHVFRDSYLLKLSY